MSYTRTITSNGNSISQEGGQSFNQQLDDLQEQIEEGGGGSITDLGTSSGTANALAGASLVDTATTFTAGRLYRIRTNAANSGAATCSINGGTGVAMKKSPSSAALASGDIADATELLLYYDGTNLQVLSGLTVSADDIPARRTLIATLASQTLAGGYNRLEFSSATRNDGLFTVSGNVFTAVANCVVQVSWAMYSADSAQVNPVVRKNASNYIQASPGQISAGCYASIPVELSIGDTLEVYAYSDTGSIDLDVSIAALNKLIIVEA